MWNDGGNQGETLEQTATRETFAQTGIPVELLPVAINTPATTPSSTEVEDRPKAAIEPIAVSQRPVRGVLTITFWYVAAAGSSAVQQEGVQQENKGFDTIWMDFDEVASVLSFDEDQQVAKAGIAAACREATAAS